MGWRDAGGKTQTCIDQPRKYSVPLAELQKDSPATQPVPEKTLRVELHCHTLWSHDCGTDPKQLMLSAKKRGIGMVAVTDHNQIGGAFEAAEQNILPVIIGEEILSSEGEIIGYFLDQWIPPGLSPEETIARIRDQGGVVSVPHPGDRIRRSTLKRDSLTRIMPLIDMVEIFNARNTGKNANIFARDQQERNNKIAAVGTDAHTAWEIGRSWQEIKAFSTSVEFLDSMRMARLHTVQSPYLVHFASTYQKLRRRLIGPPAQRALKP